MCTDIKVDGMYKDGTDDFLVDGATPPLQMTDDVTDDVIDINDEIGVNQGALDLPGVNDASRYKKKPLTCYYCQESGHSFYKCD